MKKKILTMITLLSGIMIGFTGIKIIDYICKKKPEDALKPLKKSSEKCKEWLEQQDFKELEMTSKDHLKLHAKLLEASVPTNKVLIAVHGYRSYNMRQFANYIKFYHDLGFHILLPNNRAHGNSEGKFIGFGWLDRLDCIAWIYKMKEYFNQDLQIVLHGISMGSATVLMASGEKLPRDVKCIISDCGFTSMIDELKYEMKKKKYPSPLILPLAIIMSQFRAGYNFKDASTIKQVKKSQTPTLFIHGDQDDYVPTYMVYDLYKACPVEKDLLIIEGAAHAESFIVNEKLCKKTITEFINQYVN